MKITKKGLSLAVAAALPFVSFSSVAMFNGADARGGAMGGTGVASAEYLAASFYNPAMATNYTQGDDFGMILPVVAIGVLDSDDLYSEVEDFQDINDRLSDNPSEAELDAWRNALRDLDNKEVDLDVIVGASVAVPNRFASANLFFKAQVASMAKANVVESDLTNPTPNPDDLDSTVQGLAGGTMDLGLTLAKEFALPIRGQRISVGISPKFQRLYSLNYLRSVSDFDEDDFEIDDAAEATEFNLDLGLAYKPSNYFTVGLAAQNLLKQELESNVSRGTQATFLVEPQYTAGVAFDNGWLLVSADVDLTEKQYFRESNYKTQFARVGLELDAWRWAQARVGYSHSMTDSTEDMLTGGIGLTPFGAFGLDIAAQYGGDNHYGASAQLVFMF